MYNDFYGFRESPFNITPDPRFLFMSERHREAFDHLLFGIRERKGFIQLTGEVGAGKTTLCRAALESLGPGFKTALILNPCLTAAQLVRAILVELHLKPGRDRAANIEILNRFLLEQVATGGDVVLLIDEAQDLSPELLEEVRLLSNLETDQRKLLQIALIGQPELRDKLNDRGLRQLRQRITVRYHLTPLDAFETRHYVSYRLRVAGADGRPTFNRWAYFWIHRYSKGVPRLINAVCDKTLLCGYVDSTQELTGRHVRRAIRELEGRVA
jgi:general secretion pathway protein A